jgi:phage terminase small subunit
MQVIPITISPRASRGLPPPPPRGYSAEAKRLWCAVHADWLLDPVATETLDGFCVALMRKRQAQVLIRKHGLLVTDRWGQLKANPAVAIERDCDATMLRCLRALKLDLEPLHDAAGRPGAAD